MINIPRLIDLCNGIKGDIESFFSITIPATGKNFFRAWSNTYGAKLKLLYLLIANAQKNALPDTAEPESAGGSLERFGRLQLNRNPYKPVAGVYELTVTGSIGATLPEGTTFKSDDDSSNPGFLFRLDDAVVLSAVSENIQVRALTAGTDSALALLDKLTATAPISLVSSATYVATIVTPPLTQETEKDYRNKILAAYRREPIGGAVDDYRLWAQDAQGVLEVYPYAKSGDPNIIQVYVEATIADSVDGKGTPTAQLLSDVEDVIELNPDTTLSRRTRRPMGVLDVEVLPITVQEIDITIPTLTNFTASQKALIATAMEDMLSTVRPFVAGGDILAQQNDRLDANKIIGVIITAVPGASFASPTFTVDGVPYTTYTFLDGFIPHQNSISYT